MRDIHCKQCGEPYSQYSMQNEVPEWDDQPDNAWELFSNGRGCPTCNWGEKAGEVSLSEELSEEELAAKHAKSGSMNSDEDPLKFF